MTRRFGKRKELMKSPSLTDWAGTRTAVGHAVTPRCAASKAPLLMSLDGRSGCGKSTLASLVAWNTDAVVIPVEDFYSGFISDGVRDRLTVGTSQVFERLWALLNCQPPFVAVKYQEIRPNHMLASRFQTRGEQGRVSWARPVNSHLNFWRPRGELGQMAAIGGKHG